MKLNKKVFVFIAIIIFLLIINYCNNIRENFSNDYSHTVNLPINTTYSCKNMCGPQARCSITGEQCTSDIDCFGCKAVKNEKKVITTDVLGVNEAGKLTFNNTPTYSTLTTDIGTRANLYNENNLNPPKYFQGVDQWTNTFDIGNKLYDKRYNPGIEILPFLPKYPERVTLSGEFIDNGALASNEYINL